MNAAALLIPWLFAAAPSIEWALAQRTGPSTATLVLLKADRRLQAVCFDPDGLDPAQTEQAVQEALKRPIWLYLGPRRVAQGRIESLEAAATPAGPCAVRALARFEQAVPLVAAGDVLWASTAKESSQARRPRVPDAIERARRALPEATAHCFAAPRAAIARGTEGGTYVGLVGEADGGLLSAVVLVAREGPSSLIALEAGELTLIDVLDPQARRGHTLALARQAEGTRRIELWRVLPSGLERLVAEGEY
jgi:hypothetical protein